MTAAAPVAIDSNADQSSCHAPVKNSEVCMLDRGRPSRRAAVDPPGAGRHLAPTCDRSASPSRCPLGRHGEPKPVGDRQGYGRASAPYTSRYPQIWRGSLICPRCTFERNARDYAASPSTSSSRTRSGGRAAAARAASRARTRAISARLRHLNEQYRARGSRSTRTTVQCGPTHTRSSASGRPSGTSGAVRARSAGSGRDRVDARPSGSGCAEPGARGARGRDGREPGAVPVAFFIAVRLSRPRGGHRHRLFRWSGVVRHVRSRP